MWWKFLCTFIIQFLLIFIITFNIILANSIPVLIKSIPKFLIDRTFGTLIGFINLFHDFFHFIHSYLLRYGLHLFDLEHVMALIELWCEDVLFRWFPILWSMGFFINFEGILNLIIIIIFTSLLLAIFITNILSLSNFLNRSSYNLRSSLSLGLFLYKSWTNFSFSINLTFDGIIGLKAFNSSTRDSTGFYCLPSTLNLSSS